MTLRRIKLTNYACFIEPTDLELASIVVLFGRNHSGKSALVRSLRVLATGFKTDALVPLDLPALGEEAPEFTDLVHNNLDHGNIKVTWEFDEAELSATIQNLVDDGESQVVSEWRLRSGVTDVHLKWDPTDPGDRHQRPYRVISEGDADERAAVTFHGLQPEGLDLPQEILLPKYPDIRMLGPFRNRMARRTRLLAAPPLQDSQGSHTAAILIHDHARGSGELIRVVNEQLAKHLPGWTLEVIRTYNAFSVGLRSTNNRDLWVSATDSGTGVTQLLPLLVRRAQDETDPPTRDTIEVVEEPELHLHPSAQAALADMYIEAARQPKLRFLVETHSETFLLRLRRRIAEGTLDPDSLVLYYLENDGARSHARRIHVSDLGDVDWWPEGIFSEDFDEVRKLSLAQRIRREQDAC